MVLLIPQANLMRARWILAVAFVIVALGAAGAVYWSTLPPKPKPSAVVTPEALCAKHDGGTLLVNPDDKATCPKGTHVVAAYPYGARGAAYCCGK